MTDRDYLIIPDVHGRTFWRDAVKGREDRRIIFLGNYLDPYCWEGISQEEAFLELKDIVELKKAHMDTVTLLLGNHDLGYLSRDLCECRMDYLHEARNRKFFLENLALFEIVCVEQTGGGKVLFTHAGVRKKWVENNVDVFGDSFDPEVLNAMLHDPARLGTLLEVLSDVSFARGGESDAGSPVWADVCEYECQGESLQGYIHLFGHSLHDGGAILLDDGSCCLDCRKAFRLTEHGSIEEMQ